MPEPMFKPVYEPPRPEEKLEELTDADIIEDSGVREVVDLTDEAVEEPEDLEAAEIREPGELQESEVVDAFEIPGFQGIEVAATLEKKNERKGTEARNEDNIIADPDTGLIGVLDGLGGEGEAGAGALASMSAEEKIPEIYSKLLKDPSALLHVQERLIDHQMVRKNPQTPELKAQYQKQLTEMVEDILEKDPDMGRKALALIEAIRQTNRAVAETGGKTTATVGFVHQTPDGEKWAVVASSGDSPAMKRRANGEIVPITKEDSLLNSLLDSGQLTEAQVKELQTNPDRKMNIPLSLAVVQAMGGGKDEYDAMQAKGIKQFPANYKLLKRAMISSLGGSKSNADPALSIRRLESGDTLIMSTDGHTDLYETGDGKTDFDALGKEFKGDSNTEDLNRARKAAKAKVSAAKKDDDIAIVTARAA
jgi:serine/threonine protein phosphatase PrpC